MGEGRLADIGGMPGGRAVQHLVENARGVRERLELFGRHAGLEPHRICRLQQQRLDDRGEVGIAAAFAEPVQRALDLPHAGADRGERVRHAVVGVVVNMDAKTIARDVPDDLGHDPFDLLGQRAAIGVAQHDPARAGVIGRLGADERVSRIGLVAVEEMLAIDQRLAPAFDDGLRRLLDRREVLFETDAERDIDVKVPRLRDQADRCDLGGEQRLKAGIVSERAARALGHAEGGEVRVAERTRFGEEPGVGGVRAGIARLDIVDPERIELLGDQPFVLDREIDAVGLRAVAERGVVEGEPFAGQRATSQVVTSSPVLGSLASFSVTPIASSSPRMRSASLKFLALRAALRASIRSPTASALTLSCALSPAEAVLTTFARSQEKPIN